MKNQLVLRLVFFAFISVLFWSCNQKNTEDADVKSFEADVRTLMLDFIEKSNVPGMGFAFYSDSIGTITLAVGTADVKKNMPFETGTHYPIQSVTKMFISILTIQIIEEGKLTLESTIDQWVDGVPELSHITIKHLLQHTSGLKNYPSSFGDEYFSNSHKIFTRNDIINAALAIPYNIDDFGKFNYTNTNFLILANIIEEITHHSIGQELGIRIFHPAEMHDTYYKPEITDDKHDIVQSYIDGYQLDMDRSNFLSNAAGGIASTLEDMIKFGHWILDNEYYTPLSSDLIGEISFDGRILFNYGLGFCVMTTELFNTKVMGHGGSNGGNSHEFYISRETGEIIIFFYNGGNSKESYSFREKLGTLFQKYR
ncbi:serine hydrolase domain-containing protein [Bacteroidota bacterium]